MLMDLSEAKEGVEYIVKDILTDDEELNSCFRWAVIVENQSL